MPYRPRKLHAMNTALCIGIGCWRGTLALGICVLVFGAPIARVESAQTAKDLARSLTFLAPFDGNTQASISAGDPLLYTLMGQNQTPKTQPGLHTEGMTSLAPGQGVSGDALRFTKREAKWLFYKAHKNLPYTQRNWSGTVSMWMRVDPQKELAPGYCDPIQITTRQWNDAAFFVDFNKEGNPRDFRLGAFADLSVWNHAKKRVDDIPEDQRPLLKAKHPMPFSSQRWTHVAFAWERFNTGAKDATATLYLDGVSQGNLQGWEQTFTWKDEEEARILIGLNYIGLLDELSCYDRALTAGEIRFLSETKSGLAKVLAPHRATAAGKP